jgi:hypothetical protein
MSNSFLGITLQDIKTFRDQYLVLNHEDLESHNRTFRYVKESIIQSITQSCRCSYADLIHTRKAENSNLRRSGEAAFLGR